MAKWYDIKAAADGDGQQPPTIFLYDEIGYWGTSATDFANDLKALGNVPNLTVRINSGGGEFFAGLAINNLLRTHPAKVTVKIDAFAGSIASVIAMAGDTVEMPSNAMMMVHNVSWYASGTADDLREVAGIMDQMRKSLVAAYRTKTGLDDAKIDELLTDGGTWMTAAEAKELGFCDVVTDSVDATNFTTVQPGRILKVPEAVAAKFSATPTPPAPPAPPHQQPEDRSMTTPPINQPAPATNATPAEIATACHTAGFPELTAKLLTSPVTNAAVTARLEEAKNIVKAAADLQVSEAAARRLIGEGVSETAARGILTDLKASTDTHIDTTKPAGGQPQASMIDYKGAFARMNGIQRKG
ncbi:head maturation protease, ClpP-related [Azospirillum sp. A26]|uniref:head maturation protease, ClpP-related n=1 Tax=Azospirillum sp. A26 TaxID=3160607 RepID=UPI00366D0C2E